MNNKDQSGHTVKIDLHRQLRKSAREIAERTAQEAHDLAIVLGSGLGALATDLPVTASVPYHEIPGFPLPKVLGHPGILHSAYVGKSRVLILAGRVHAYEGHGLNAVTFPVRTAIFSGCTTLVITNVCGACGDGFTVGDLVLLRDHLNLAGLSPLLGQNDERLGPRFLSLFNAYDPKLREIAHNVGTGMGLELKEGVYAWFLGPMFETPAEVRMAKILGADLVGMSTVPEVIAARHMGATVLGISLVTNLAEGMTSVPVSHESVLQEGEAASETFGRFLHNLVSRI